MEEFRFSREEWESCIKVLGILKEDPFANPDNQAFKTLITALHKQARRQVKRATYLQKKEEDKRGLKATTIIEQATQISTHFSPTATEPGNQKTELHFARYCYVCGSAYHDLHFFYHKLCPSCATLHYDYRNLSCNLSGQQVILTGGRVKVGYATALKVLRAGASLLLTTRFPAIAQEILAAEPDYEQWKERLIIYGLDLRNLKEVKRFIAFCELELDSLEILINNAAQTIKYPAEYYQPLVAKEQLYQQLARPGVIANTTPVSGAPVATLTEASWINDQLQLNRFGQPVDTRENNSWNAGLNDIGLEELLEVNLINHISPYCLISGLKGLMLKSAFEKRFIINVTSSEGQFNYPNKNTFHPHTNMTKAALNMLTRTSGAELVKEGIYMNAVDVGWISTGAPEPKRQRLFNDLRIPPLDPVDGAARILHPVAAIGEGTENWFGVLLKDFQVAEW